MKIILIIKKTLVNNNNYNLKIKLYKKIINKKYKFKNNNNKVKKYNNNKQKNLK